MTNIVSSTSENEYESVNNYTTLFFSQQEIKLMAYTMSSVLKGAQLTHYLQYNYNNH